MEAGPPDSDAPQAAPRSLLDRAFERDRRERPTPAPRDWRAAALVSGLIALAPLLTLGGAHLLTARETAAADRLRSQAAPRIAARAAGTAARRTLSETLRQPNLGATLEALARALPANATLARAGRAADGTLEIEAAAPDPDALRDALRRDPAFARLRAIGQRQADGAIVTAFRGTAE